MTRVVSRDTLIALCDSLSKHAQAHLERKETHELEKPDIRSKPYFIEKYIHEIPSREGISQAAAFFDGLMVRILSILERIRRPNLNLGFKHVASYHFFGIVGILTAVCLTQWVIHSTDLAPAVLWYMYLSTTLVFAIYICVNLIFKKRDSGVFFHFFLSILSGNWIVLYVLNEPILPYLEVLILGLGAMFGCIKIGCFMAGCCYGLPSRYGVRYGIKHAEIAVPTPMRNLKLIPIQLIEALWIVFITGLSTNMLLNGFATGTGLVLFIILLAVGRFYLEPFRGDTNRKYFWGLSNTQWISLSMVGFVLTAMWLKALPFEIWLAAPSFLFILYAGAWLIYRGLSSAPRFIPAKHMDEFVRLFEFFEKSLIIPASTRKSIHIKALSCTLQFSQHTLRSDRHTVHQITISSFEGTLRKRQAIRLASLIRSWYPYYDHGTLIPDKEGVFHLVYFQNAE